LNLLKKLNNGIIASWRILKKLMQ